jgi:hypothetical protein
MSMMSLGKAEHKVGGVIKNLDAHELYEQLDTMRAYLTELTGAFGKSANRQWGRGREVTIGAAHEAEETLKNNLAVSLIIAMGVGVLVGYMIRRGSE